MIIFLNNEEVVKFKAETTDDVITIDKNIADKIFSICDRWYVGRNVYYEIVSISGRNKQTKEKVSLPALIMGESLIKGFDVHHRDFDKLNNRRYNLSCIAHFVNCHATRLKRRAGSSKHRGVSFRKDKNKWDARIRIGDNQRLFLGYFNSEEDASLAYNEAAKKYFGEYAMQNEQGLKEIKE